NTEATILKELPKGTVLTLKPFWNNWYATELRLDGQTVIGYLLQDTIEIAMTERKSLSGVSLENKTNVYRNPSTSSEVLKTYSQGAILKYQTFSSDWYKATVYVNGVKHT